MKPRELKEGDVVQISPDVDSVFGGCLMIVTQPKPFGAQGYVKTIPLTKEQELDGQKVHAVTFNGMAFYRCKFEDMEYVGKVTWIGMSKE